MKTLIKQPTSPKNGNIRLSRNKRTQQLKYYNMKDRTILTYLRSSDKTRSLWKTKRN
mgnify:FL=1